MSGRALYSILDRLGFATKIEEKDQPAVHDAAIRFLNHFYFAYTQEGIETAKQRISEGLEGYLEQVPSEDKITQLTQLRKHIFLMGKNLLPDNYQEFSINHVETIPIWLKAIEDRIRDKIIALNPEVKLEELERESTLFEPIAPAALVRQTSLPATFFEIFERLGIDKNKQQEDQQALNNRMSVVTERAKAESALSGEIKDEDEIIDELMKDTADPLIQSIKQELDQFIEKLNKGHMPAFQLIMRLSLLDSKLDDYLREQVKTSNDNPYGIDVDSVSFIRDCMTCLDAALEKLNLDSAIDEQQDSQDERYLKAKLNEYLRRCDLYKRKLEKLFSEHVKKIKGVDLKEMIDLTLLLPIISKQTTNDREKAQAISNAEGLSREQNISVLDKLQIDHYSQLVAKSPKLGDLLKAYEQVYALDEQLQKSQQSDRVDLFREAGGALASKNKFFNDFSDFLVEKYVSQSIKDFVRESLVTEHERVRAKYKLQDPQERQKDPKEYSVAQKRYQQLVALANELQDTRKITFSELCDKLTDLYESTVSTGRFFKFITRKGPGWGHSIFGVTGKRRIHDILDEIDKMHKEEMASPTPPSHTPRRGSSS